MNLILSLLFFLPSFAFGGLLRTQSETYYSQYRAENKNIESPLFEQFSASYLTDSRKNQYDLNFGYYYNFSRNTYDFDLHMLRAEFQADQSRLTFGRQFETFRLLRATVIDSFSYDYQLNSQVRFGAIVGKLRQFELGNDEKEATVGGLSANFQTSELFPWKTGLQLENRNYTSVDRSAQSWGKFSLRKETSLYLNPEILVNIEENLDRSRSYRREVGVDFYPSLVTTYGLRAQAYRMDNYEVWEDPVSSIFAIGEVQEVSALLQHQIGSNWSTGLDFGYNQYALQSEQKTNGYRGEWSLRWFNERRMIENSAFRISSYGGWVNGNRLRLVYPWTDRLEFELSHEGVQYQKITSAKSQASSAQAGLGYWFWRQCRFWVAGELNSNHFYSQDVSLLARLTIYDWREL